MNDLINKITAKLELQRGREFAMTYSAIISAQFLKDILTSAKDKFVKGLTGSGKLHLNEYILTDLPKVLSCTRLTGFNTLSDTDDDCDYYAIETHFILGGKALVMKATVARDVLGNGAVAYDIGFSLGGEDVGYYFGVDSSEEAIRDFLTDHYLTDTNFDIDMKLASKEEVESIAKILKIL
jgi:hypothetical protein